VLQKRLKDMEDPSFKSPPDLIQLVIDGIKGGQGRSIDYQIDAQIGTGRAALFTTGVTVFHLLYDLTIHPEYIEPLRQEVLALGEVPMNRLNVAKLTKMDSFIRECQRFSKFMLGTCLVLVARLGLSCISGIVSNVSQWVPFAKSWPLSNFRTVQSCRLALSLVSTLRIQSSTIRLLKTPENLMASGTYLNKKIKLRSLHALTPH
jgi:hypothetical protein